MKKILSTFLLLIVIAGCDSQVPNQTVEPTVEPVVYHPIDNFDTGITLKPFGIYIHPSSSPVQPERFSGYHTGADIEVPEELKDIDVPVYAIADGTVELARFASGYGGVIAIQHETESQSYIAVYGHIDLESVDIPVGDTVSAGQQIAVLGEGFTAETDGERKHLHFAIKLGSTVDLAGYVSDESNLSEWMDPEVFFELQNAAGQE